jgi:hypothetical protein
MIALKAGFCYTEELQWQCSAPDFIKSEVGIQVFWDMTLCIHVFWDLLTPEDDDTMVLCNIRNKKKP